MRCTDDSQTEMSQGLRKRLTARVPAGRTAGAEERSRLSRVTQLTGFSDPVYAEAIVAVNQYDIVLDVLVVNQTGECRYRQVGARSERTDNYYVVTM